LVFPLLEAYTKAGRSGDVAKLVPEQLAEARKALPKDSPKLASALAQSSGFLLQLRRGQMAQGTRDQDVGRDGAGEKAMTEVTPINAGWQPC
jgi:hypothetical protein